ncbi:molybdate ABC transporter permease subunit [Pyrolobus fumarii]|uniref:molybdate ABC transporter permease subunit n=1 Tax=Pyrolobus fumarii TaxID=54252 RepID=UPI001FCBB63E|nr:ABC transporter permease subunit [Pyrolobus fumarii]
MTGRIVLLASAVLMLLVLSSIVLLTTPSDILEAIRSEEFRYAILLSLATSTASTILALCTALPLAYIIAGEKRSSLLAEAILSLPMAMPPVALGVTLLAFFTRNVLGVTIDKLVGVVFSIPGLVVAQYFVILPLIIKGLRSAIEAIPEEYIGIARTLGYGPIETLVYIVVPLAWRGILASTVLGFARAMGEFGASVMLAGATRLKTETIPIAIYLAMEGGDLGLAAAMTIVSLVVAFVVMIGVEVVGKWRY